MVKKHSTLYICAMKILLTGANGFVGHYLCKHLLQHRHTVIATGKGPCRLPYINNHAFSYIELDFTDGVVTEILLDKIKPDVIIHAGAMSRPDECEKKKEEAYLVNVKGTEHLLAAAALHSSFFIFLSTDFIFDGKRGMYKEEDEPGPVNHYGKTKLMAEELVKQYTRGWSIIRTVLVYGPPMPGRPHLLSNIKETLEKGKTCSMVYNQFRTPTYVEDLAAAIATVAGKKATGVFHIAGAEVLTPYLMACKAAAFLGYDPSLIRRIRTNALAEPAPRPARTGFNIDRAKAILGYNPVSFDKGLAKSFAQK